MKYIEESAKTSHNVEKIFQNLSCDMKEKFSQPYIEKYKKTPSYLNPIIDKSKIRAIRKTTCC